MNPTFPEAKDEVPPQSRQTPKSLCPTPSYSWFSPAPGRKLRGFTSSPFRPYSQPLGLFSISFGCCFLGGRAESSGVGPQISLRNVRGGWRWPLWKQNPRLGRLGWLVRVLALARPCSVPMS